MASIMQSPTDRLVECRLFEDKHVRVLREQAGQLRYKITGFMAMCGAQYDQGLMIVGRALNGGASCICPSAARDASCWDAFVSDTLEDAAACDRKDCFIADPYRWIQRDKYNAKRSAFWRVAKRVAAELGNSAENHETWSQHIVWSNLYKLAPHTGGNPNAFLRRAQQFACVEMLALELSIYQPKWVLFQTGNWFEPFRAALGRVTLRALKDCAHLLEAGESTLPSGHPLRYVVAPHPQGKPEDPIRTEILRAFAA